MRCGKTTTQSPPPLYTVRVKRQLKNKDREKRERGRERWRGNRCACTHVSKQRAPPRGLPHSPRTRDTRTRVPTVCGVTVLVKVDTTPRDRQARYISSPLPNRCLKATIYYVGGAVGPWTTRLSSSHLPSPTHSVPLLVSVPLVSGQEGEEGGRGRPRRGPTGPVSSRAFLELILFVGCQPVAAHGAGGGIEGTQNATGRRERERARSCAAMGPGSDPDPTAPNGN